MGLNFFPKFNFKSRLTNLLKYQPKPRKLINNSTILNVRKDDNVKKTITNNIDDELDFLIRETKNLSINLSESITQQYKQDFNKQTISDDYQSLKEDLKTYKVLDPNKLLIVFDLNGVLIYRKKKKKGITLRPGLEELLTYCLKHYNVAIWSSVMPKNMLKILKQVLPNYQQKLVSIFTRDQCTLNGSYYSKCETIKDLNKLWEELNQRADGKKVVHSGNTIIVDDSLVKCQLQPDNQILPEIFELNEKKDEELIWLKKYLMFINEEFLKEKKEFDVKCWLILKPFQEFKKLKEDE